VDDYVALPVIFGSVQFIDDSEITSANVITPEVARANRYESVDCNWIDYLIGIKNGEVGKHSRMLCSLRRLPYFEY
jgi:hypothetical protein